MCHATIISDYVTVNKYESVPADVSDLRPRDSFRGQESIKKIQGAQARLIVTESS